MKKIIFGLLFLLVLFGGVNLVTAANLGDAFGTETLDKAAGSAGAGFKTDATPELIIASVIQIILSFLGVIFLVLVFYGGFMWMTAKGNEEQVSKAKDIITAATIGLGVIVSAYAISYFVVSALTSTTLQK